MTASSSAVVAVDAVRASGRAWTLIARTCSDRSRIKGIGHTEAVNHAEQLAEVGRRGRLSELTRDLRIGDGEADEILQL